MPVYVQPTFNLTCNIWRASTPTTDPPDVVSLGNLSPGRLLGTAVPAGASQLIGVGGMWLRLPAGTDIRDKKGGGTGDVVEVGAGSSRFYNVVWVDDIGGGFPNEHRFAVLQGQNSWPVPFPGPGDLAPPPPPPPPPPMTAVKLTSGNTSGAPVSPWNVPFTMPANGRVVVGVAEWVGGGGMTCNFDLLPNTLPTVGAMIGALGVGNFIRIYEMDLLAGNHSVTFTKGAVQIPVFQYFIIFVDAMGTLLTDLANGTGTAGTPAIAGMVINAPDNGMNVVFIAEHNTTGLNGYQAPFIGDLATNVWVQNPGGFNNRMSWAEVYSDPGVPLNAILTFANLCGAWGATQVHRGR